MECDKDLFVARYLPKAREIAERYGFAVERPAGQVVNARVRVESVRVRMLRATRALTDLQQWLVDDDPAVRREARASIHRCLRAAYVGDQPEPHDGQLGSFFRWVDRRLWHQISRRIDPDQPMPGWASPRGLRALRAAGIAAVVGFAAVAGGLLVADQPLLAVLALVGVACCDTLEGSFARVTGMRDPLVRWGSCLASHFADATVLAGIVLAEWRSGASGRSSAVLVATCITLFGSFVRVSALQAGFRFWRAPLERLVRYTAFCGYAGAAYTGHQRAGIGLLCAMLGLFGVGEAIRVVRRVANERFEGALLFLSDETATCVGLEDDNESTTAEHVLTTSGMPQDTVANPR